jgi:hypothetical protein
LKVLGSWLLALGHGAAGQCQELRDRFFARWEDFLNRQDAKVRQGRQELPETEPFLLLGDLGVSWRLGGSFFWLRLCGAVLLTILFLSWREDFKLPIL